jgi:hypothetical protein
VGVLGVGVPSAARQRLIRNSVLVILALAPVWLSPVPPTTDGPNHVYNAFVRHDLETGGTAYRSVHRLRAGLAPNQAAEEVLIRLGPVIGWRRAEKVLLSLAILVPVVALLTLAGASDWVAIVTVGTLVQNWFVWMGFYDFALSIALFAFLATVLTRTRGVTRVMLTQAVFLALFFTHLFTFAAGIGLLLGRTLWRRIVGRGSLQEGLNAVPALALFVVEFSSAGRVGGVGPGVSWGDPVRGLLGLVVGDVVVTFHPIYLLAGVALMVAVWWTGARVLRRLRREGWKSLDSLTAAGLSLLAISLLVPDAMVEGSYVRARVRLLAIVLLLPALLGTLRGLGTSARRRVAVGGILLLVLHAGWVMVLGRRLERDRRDIAGALGAAGTRPGDWLQTVLRDKERGFYRISAYLHLSDRLATEQGLVVLDNYEAFLQNFSVAWLRVPDELVAAPSGNGWALRRVARELCPATSIFVVHERDRALRSADSLVAVGGSEVRGSFAVTKVMIECSP